jgi:phage shock protein A
MSVDAREALRRLIAAEHRVHEQMRQQEQLAERWQARAELALRRGEDELAREALARQAEHDRRARGLRGQYLEYSRAVHDAKQRLRIRTAASARVRSHATTGAGLPAGGQAGRSPEAKLDRLAAEDRLERDLRELKERLAPEARSSERGRPA